jgi:membrane protein implicated in regulation of membrane protease activity
MELEIDCRLQSNSRQTEPFVAVKYLVWLLVVGLLGVVALIMAGYCLWLTTTSLSYARVNTVENELLLSLGVFLLASAGSVVIIMRWVRSKQSRPSSKTS